MSATFETLLALDARLTAKGHRPLTPWWKGELARFYGHPTARALVARVGRGGAKSHTSTKISLNEVLFGNWNVPPGERHFWAFVSISKDEAAQRLTLLERFLSDLGVGYDRKGDEIHLHDLPLGWRVMACQVASTSGFRCIGRSLDELAKWRNSDGANPAREVAASTAAMMVTHPSARSVLISSPLGTLDYHAERFDLGDTGDQLTAHAASWIANPDGISEVQTRQLEPDRKVWLREYAAIPQAQFGSAFDPELVALAFRVVPMARRLPAIGIVDASSGGGDAFAYGVASYAEPPDPHTGLMNVFRAGVRIHPETQEPLDLALPPPSLVMHHVDAIEGRFKGTITGDAIINRVAANFREWGVQTVVGDQRESLFLSSEFARRNMMFRELPWTNAGKIDAVRHIREHLGRRTLILPARDKLKRELLGYAERITATGAITYSARSSGHDDEASLVMTLAMAELERLVPGSPFHFSPGRHEVPGH